MGWRWEAILGQILIVCRDTKCIWSSNGHFCELIQLHHHHLNRLLLLCQNLIAQLLITRQDSQTLENPKLMRIRKPRFASNSSRHCLAAELAMLLHQWCAFSFQIQLHSIANNSLRQRNIALPEPRILAVLGQIVFRGVFLYEPID